MKSFAGIAYNLVQQTLHMRIFCLLPSTFCILHSTFSFLPSIALASVEVQSNSYAQVPVFSSDETFSPDTFEVDEPIPPLGYPEQLPQSSPSSQFNLYHLGIGDSIQVQILNFPDLNFQDDVDLEGDILIPLAGKVPVLGLTLEQVKEKIETSLNEFVVNPEAIVALAGLRPAKITVTGEVSEPGYYTLPAGTLLPEVLQQAGGTTTEADLRTIVVRRRLPNNSIIEQQIDLFSALQNGTSLPNFRLQDGDAVIVLKTEIGTTNDYDRTLVARSNVAQQEINIRVLSYANERIGSVTLPNGSTFVDALTAIAPNPDGVKINAIALIRFDPETGRAVSQELNGKAALTGDVSQDVPLQDNDVIIVGRNLIGKLNFALNFITQPFANIFSFIRFFDVFSGN
ncbi:MAG: polysaccharide export protein [Symploca sp. SIO2C1]|nr:polysaccharide export protein [Symploca sp. SIO2C1]